MKTSSKDNARGWGQEHKDNDDDEEPCRFCGRNGEDVEKEKKSNELLPYEECDECGETTYLKPDPDHWEEGFETSTELSDLCYWENWDLVLKRLKIYPKEASIGGRYGTALYWACESETGAPLHVIEALIATAPEMGTVCSNWPRRLGDRIWVHDGYPIDSLLTERENKHSKVSLERDEIQYDLEIKYDLGPDVLEKINTILKHNTEAASLSIGTVWRVIEDVVVRAVEEFEKKKPGEDGPFFFLKETAEENDSDVDKKKDNSQYPEQQEAELCWSIFCYLTKVAYYKTLDCDHLPLVIALVDCRYFYRERGSCAQKEAPGLPLKFAAKIFPEQIETRDADGNTLIHLACKLLKPIHEKEDGDGESEDELWYESSFTKDQYDSHNKDQIYTLLSLFPGAAGIRNRDGDLPVHLAIKARKTPAIISKILEVYPEAMKEADGEGNTLLHLAASIRHPIKIRPIRATDRMDLRFIKKLLELDPTMVRARNRSGQLPLHVALKSGKEWGQGVEILLEKYEEAVKTYDSEGMYALHYACTCSSYEAVNVLIKKYPKALKKANNKGKLPLHLISTTARYGDGDFEWTIRRVLKAYPQAAKVADGEGMFPLNLLLAHRQFSLDHVIVKALLDAHPGAVYVANGDGFYPFAVAAMHDSETRYFDNMLLTLSFYLLRAWPEALANSLMSSEKDGQTYNKSESITDADNPPAKKKRKIEHRDD